MKHRFFITLTILLAGASSSVFSQDQIQLFGSNQSYLGVQIRDITASEVGDLRLPRQGGIYIVGVQKDSPAARSDLREGDVIMEFGSFTVVSRQQFRRLVSETPSGRQVELALIRQGQRISKTVTIDDRESSGIWEFLGENPRSRLPRRGFSSSDQPRLGIQGEALTEQLGEVLGVPEKKGVLLMEVLKDSPAEKAGLKAGDVIMSVGSHPVQSVSDVSGYLKPGPVELEVIRDKRKQITTVELGTRQRQGKSMRL